MLAHEKTSIQVTTASGDSTSQAESFLFKRGQAGLQLYSKRYFLLRDDELYYCLGINILL